MNITGAGATFPYPLYRAWFAEYGAKHNVRFNYYSVGSEEGLQLLKRGEVDFGATEREYKRDTAAPEDCVALAIPMVTGAVAIAYNLPGKEREPLKLDVHVLAEIYAGRITRWDAPGIRALNRNRALPAAPLTVVHRGKGSGTGLAFSTYLSKSGRWAAPSDISSVRWPVGIAAEGNEGVAAEVKATTFAIGFMELAYARQNHLAIAAVRTPGASYVMPGDVAQEYPIRAKSWLVLESAHVPASKGVPLVAFVRWALTQGGAQARGLQYVSPPTDTVAHYDSALSRFRFGCH